jgi:NTP pyrophosphatase (non-canonical NTP hydrolase)
MNQLSTRVGGRAEGRYQDVHWERDWEQFNSPKNLAMALSVEPAEVVEHFQWLTEEQSISLPPEKLAEVREEIGDVMIYLTELAEELGRPGRGRQSER